MILLAPTAFKGTLTPKQASHAMAQAVQEIRPAIRYVKCPLADGGDGTLDVLMSALKGKFKRAPVKGPLGNSVKARWGRINKISGFQGPVGIIEMAEASGLRLLRGKNRIREATTEGTGQLIKAAIQSGCRTLIIGVGGTATSDGGAGALHALGFRFLDKYQKELKPTPSELIHLVRIDRSRLDPRNKTTVIYVLCDVTNPLLGSRGSAKTFGSQKGASAADVEFLERFLKKLSGHAQRGAHRLPGSGSAGGMAFGLAGFLGARLKPGGPFVLKTVGWKKLVQRAALIITGEGRIDGPSFSGKVVGAVCAARQGRPVSAVCGATVLKKSQLKKKGIQDFEVLGKTGLINSELAVKKATLKLLERWKN